MQVQKIISIGGKSVASSIAPSVASEDATQTTLAAGKAGTLSTRTDTNTGILTLAADHGITTGQTIDLYWSGGLRRGMTVGTVAGTSVPVDLGDGDDLPAQATAIVACVQTIIDVDFDGDTVAFAMAHATARSSVVIQDDVNAAIVSLDLAAAETWDNYPAIEEPLFPFNHIFVGVTIGRVVVSNGSSAGANVVTIGFGRNNVS